MLLSEPWFRWFIWLLWITTIRLIKKIIVQTKCWDPIPIGWSVLQSRMSSLPAGRQGRRRRELSDFKEDLILKIDTMLWDPSCVGMTVKYGNYFLPTITRCKPSKFKYLFARFKPLSGWYYHQRFVIGSQAGHLVLCPPVKVKSWLELPRLNFSGVLHSLRQ